MDDRRLLTLMWKGRESAARALWERHGPRLVALAGAMLRGRGGSSDGSDVVQSVFLSVLSADRRTIRGVDDVGAYLASATRNAALNAMRGEDRLAARGEAAARTRMGAAGSPDDDRGLRDALDEMSEDERELLLLKHVAGLTFDQISMVLGVARGTVASRHGRALEGLRARVARTAEVLDGA